MVNLEIRKSKAHGKGVYTLENIKKGDTILIVRGKRKHFEVRNKKDSAVGPTWIGTKHGEWVDPEVPASYLNHSCDPNAGFKSEVTLKALRNIKKGEEITFDYSTTEDDIFWDLGASCRCGSKKCRHKIRAIQFLPKSFFYKYLPFISPYFQSVFLRKNK